MRKTLLALLTIAVIGITSCNQTSDQGKCEMKDSLSSCTTDSIQATDTIKVDTAIVK